MGLDNLGLFHQDRQYLSAIIDKFNGGPVGVETLASALSEDRQTLEDFVEPFLLQLGLIQRTPQGRVASKQAYSHLGKTSAYKNP